MGLDWEEQQEVARAILQGDEAALQLLREWLLLESYQRLRQRYDSASAARERAEEYVQEFIVQAVLPADSRDKLFGATAAGRFEGFRKFVARRLDWFIRDLEKRERRRCEVEMAVDEEGRVVDPQPGSGLDRNLRYEPVRTLADSERDARIEAAVSSACELLVRSDLLRAFRERKAPYYPCILLDTRLAWSDLLGVACVDALFGWDETAGGRKIGPRSRSGPTLDEAWSTAMEMATGASPPSAADLIRELGIQASNWHQWLSRARAAVREAIGGERREMFPHWETPGGGSV